MADIIGNDGERLGRPEDPELAALHDELLRLTDENNAIERRVAMQWNRQLEPIEVVKARVTMIFDAICPHGTQERYEFEIAWQTYILGNQKRLEADLTLKGAPRVDQGMGSLLVPGFVEPNNLQRKKR